MAQEEGMAAGQGQNELPAHSQAVVPMEVDEEQAGNSCFWKKLPFWYPLLEGLNFQCKAGFGWFSSTGLSAVFGIMMLAQLTAVKKFILV